MNCLKFLDLLLHHLLFQRIETPLQIHYHESQIKGKFGPTMDWVTLIARKGGGSACKTANDPACNPPKKVKIMIIAICISATIAFLLLMALWYYCGCGCSCSGRKSKGKKYDAVGREDLRKEQAPKTIATTLAIWRAEQGTMPARMTRATSLREAVDGGSAAGAWVVVVEAAAAAAVTAAADRVTENGLGLASKRILSASFANLELS
jgi:hypothetical protein